MLLLDTHAFIWLVSDQSHLSDNAKEKISDIEQDVYISSISALEISILNKRNKLKLPLPVKDFIQKAMEQHGIEEIEINNEILIHSAFLPDIHNDPFDRIIIATAQLQNMFLVTKDRIISTYPDVKTVW